MYVLVTPNSMERRSADAMLTFILGGARSGKSDYGLTLARTLAGDAPVLFIATAQPGDDEMADRIAHHQAERPEHWQTMEAVTEIGAALTAHLADIQRQPAVILLDCLTLLVSNVLFADGRTGEDEAIGEAQARLDAELEQLLVATRDTNLPTIIVSNEVGLGVVPVGRISRVYTDLIGRANRRLAAAADRAIFLLAGIALNLKELQIDQE